MANSRGRYLIAFTVTNPTTAPFLQFATPSNAGLRLLEFFCGQEAGETAEQIAITMQRRTTASTMASAAAAIAKLDPTDANSRLATTTTTNGYGTATATGSAADLMYTFTGDSRVGIQYAPSAEEASLMMDISQFATFQFKAAPAANVYSGFAIVEEC